MQMNGPLTRTGSWTSRRHLYRPRNNSLPRSSSRRHHNGRRRKNFHCCSGNYIEDRLDYSLPSPYMLYRYQHMLLNNDRQPDFSLSQCHRNCSSPQDTLLIAASGSGRSRLSLIHPRPPALRAAAPTASPAADSASPAWGTPASTARLPGCTGSTQIGRAHV